jgi:hypothetical protein
VLQSFESTGKQKMVPTLFMLVTSLIAMLLGIRKSMCMCDSLRIVGVGAEGRGS